MPKLIFYVENGYPEIASLDNRRTKIGRAEDNSLLLDDSRISDYHAEIVRKGEGAYQLVDLNSNNGTAVNGKLIEEIDLRDGDQIKFGPVNATYVDFSESAEDKLIRKTVERDLQAKIERLAKIEQTIEDRTKVMKEIQEGQEKLDSLEAEFAEVSQKRNSEQASLQSIQKQIESARETLGTLRADISTQEQELGNLEKDCVEAQHEYRETRKAYENSVRLKYDSNVELETLVKEVESTKSSLKECKEAFDTARTVIDQGTHLQNRLAELEDRIGACKESYVEMGNLIKSREGELAELSDQIETRKTNLEDLNQDLELRQRVSEALNLQIDEKESLINNSCELLEGMESTLGKEEIALSEVYQIQSDLSKENQSLSHLIRGKTAILHRLDEKLSAKEKGIETQANCPPFRIIDPTMASLVKYYQHGAGIPDQDQSNPIGHSALAACTFGSMHREVDTIPDNDDPVLILLDGELEKDIAQVDSVARDLPGRILLICWREGGIDESIDAKPIKEFLLPHVYGIISTDSNSGEIIDQLTLGCPHLNLILPCPVDSPDWNLPVERRTRGIFVSVNGFDPNSKAHCERLELLNQVVDMTRTSTSLYHFERVPELIERLQIPNLVSAMEPLDNYSDYLTFVRQHHFVMSFGANLNGGDVLCDSILSKNIYLGARFTSVVGQILFPEYSEKNSTFDSALKNAVSVYNDREAYQSSVDKIQDLAQEVVSFQAANQLLSEFLKVG